MLHIKIKDFLNFNVINHISFLTQDIDTLICHLGILFFF